MCVGKWYNEEMFVVKFYGYLIVDVLEMICVDVFCLFFNVLKVYCIFKMFCDVGFDYLMFG